MDKPKVKFNTKNNPEFFQTVRARVNKHFKDNKITKQANGAMKFKTVFMVSLYLIPLILMLVGIVTNLWMVILMWAIMGFGMSGIGLSVMHDANHGSYSTNKNVNNALGFLVNIIGGYHINWKIQHNVLHHTYTNIDGYDEDIAKPVMRFSPNQERKPIYRYQIFYAPFLYGIMTIYWFISKDIEQLFRYHKRDLLRPQGITIRKAVASVIFNKIWYAIIFIVLPIMLIPIAWWQVVIGFLLMHFISGITLAFVFQPAHVVGETEFYEVDENNSVENNWAIHQLRTTSNFANNSTLFSWYVGGLNFQIEHHLFPNICHIHYKNISSIVKATALEFNLPYHHHNTFARALKSHFVLLNDLGTGKYDTDQLVSTSS